MLHINKEFFEKIRMTFNEKKQQGWYALMLSGFMSSLLSVIIPYPLDVIRTRQQANISRDKMFHLAVINMYKKYGLKGFYKGITGVFVFDAPATILYFGSYVKAKELFKYIGIYNPPNILNESELDDISLLSFKNSFIEGLSGIIASGFGSIFWTPMDTIVQKSQCTSWYNTPKRITQAILIKEGLPRFWKGYYANMLTLAPMGMLFFIQYEMYKRIYHKIFTINNSNEISFNNIIFSSSLSGILSIFITQPLDTLRCQIQLNGARGIPFNHQTCNDYNSKLNAILYNEGIKRLMFKGFIARVLSTGPDLILGIISFEVFIKYFSGNYI